MLAVGILLLVFLLPFLALLTYYDIYASVISQSGNDVSDKIVALKLQTSLLEIIACMVLFFGLGGIFYLLRQLSWGEPTSVLAGWWHGAKQQTFCIDWSLRWRTECDKRICRSFAARFCQVYSECVVCGLYFARLAVCSCFRRDLRQKDRKSIVKRSHDVFQNGTDNTVVCRACHGAEIFAVGAEIYNTLRNFKCLDSGCNARFVVWLDVLCHAQFRQVY